MGQTEDSKYALGVNVTHSEYWGDLGSDVWRISQGWKEGFGLSLGRYLSPSFDLGLQGNWGTFGYRKDAIDNFNGKKLDVGLSGHFKLNNGYMLSEDSRLSPFVSLGLGFVSYFRNNGNPEPENPKIIELNSMAIPLGIGLKFKVNEILSLQYKYQFNFTTADRMDETRVLGNNTNPDGSIRLPIYERMKSNDGFGNHMLSFVFNLSRVKDTDGDGIPDKLDRCNDTPANVAVDASGCPLDGDGDKVPDYLDKCANTPANVKVDAAGCPVDSDKDGVADYLDKCANTPANVKVDASGCPVDTDKDGIADYLDKCANTPAGVKVDASGCPVDTDKDGVADYLDKCANTPTGVKVDASGCPVDSDNDGVVNDLDKCANTPAGVKVDASGCPVDTDKDGVADYLDKCPDVAGVAGNKGCPEIKEETKKIFTKALQGIQFESGKDVLKTSSYTILNQVVTVLRDNPTYILEINGHTDSQGDDATNLILSKNRAGAVKSYLVNKGIDGSRLMTEGYGESMPVADNATAAGRTLNRRVEFKVVF